MKSPVYLVCSGVLLVAVMAGGSRPVEAIGGCIPGSYLAQEGSGTHSLWTFTSDGTLQVASSAQWVFNFSDIQGTWRREGAYGVRAVALDFGFRPEPVGDGVPPQWTTRIDVAIEFARDCQDFEGGFDLRFYEDGQDPLDPSAVSSSGSDTVTARRIQVP